MNSEGDEIALDTRGACETWAVLLPLRGRFCLNRKSFFRGSSLALGNQSEGVLRWQQLRSGSKPAWDAELHRALGGGAKGHREISYATTTTALELTHQVRPLRSFRVYCLGFGGRV